MMIVREALRQQRPFPSNRYSDMYLMPKSPQCNLLDVAVRRGLNEPTLALRAAQSGVKAATNTAPAAHESPCGRDRKRKRTADLIADVMTYHLKKTRT